MNLAREPEPVRPALPRREPQPVPTLHDFEIAYRRILRPPGEALRRAQGDADDKRAQAVIEATIAEDMAAVRRVVAEYMDRAGGLDPSSGLPPATL